MTRFFKIVREDGGIFDIVSAKSVEDAARSTRSMFRPWSIVESTQDEWWSWRIINWGEVDRMENDMISMDAF